MRRSDVAGHTLYGAPLANGLCVFIDDGSSACSQDLDAIARQGVAMWVVPPIPGPIDPTHPPTGASGSGTTTVYGVAPDGVDKVVATTTTGGKVQSTVEGNAFAIVTDATVVNVQLEH